MFSASSPQFPKGSVSSGASAKKCGKRPLLELITTLTMLKAMMRELRGEVSFSISASVWVSLRPPVNQMVVFNWRRACIGARKECFHHFLIFAF
jgi:hypothetical protein